MTSDAKIGLLLGLVCIFIIAFIINGLPRFRNVVGNDELTTTMNDIVGTENGAVGIGTNERNAPGVFDWRDNVIEDTTETKKAFSGDLNDLSIVELVQMLNLNKKSGILRIDADIQGEIYLKDGQLFGAKTHDKEGEEAIYSLVTLNKGNFNFELSDKDVDQNIKNSTMNVIMEACRIMDENRHFNE